MSRAPKYPVDVEKAFQTKDAKHPSHQCLSSKMTMGRGTLLPDLMDLVPFLGSILSIMKYLLILFIYIYKVEKISIEVIGIDTKYMFQFG